MAYSFTGIFSAAQTAAATAITVSATYSAGDQAICIATYDDTGGLLSETMTDGTNTYTKIGTTEDDTVGGQCYVIFQCKNCAAGTFTVSFNLPSSRGFIAIGVTHEAGLSTTTTAVQAQNVQNNPGTGTDAVTSTNLTPGSQPGMLLGIGSADSSSITSITAGTGFTNEGALTNWDTAFSTKSRVEDKRLTSISAVASTFTLGSSGTNQTVVSFGIFVPESGGAASAVPELEYYYSRRRAA